MISTVRQVIKAPPNISAKSTHASAAAGGKDSQPLEIGVLQFFYAYLSQCSPDQVFESWGSLSGLLRDCLALAPPAIFLALSIVNQFVHRSPSPLTDRKDQKELQDIVGRLVKHFFNSVRLGLFSTDSRNLVIVNLFIYVFVSFPRMTLSLHATRCRWTLQPRLRGRAWSRRHGCEGTSR